MKLVCALFGHQPVPFLSWRRRGRWENRCVLCQRTIIHEEGRWQPAEEADADPGSRRAAPDAFPDRRDRAGRETC